MRGKKELSSSPVRIPSYRDQLLESIAKAPGGSVKDLHNYLPRVG